MLRFRRVRPPCPVPADTPLSVEVVGGLAIEVLAPHHFYLAPGLTLEFRHCPAEELAWEVFRGRLLDPAHTRQSRTFESWNLYLAGQDGSSAEPLLSLKLDAGRGELHVVRGLLCHVWEGYDAGGKVILSRETTRWVRELAGTIELARFDDAGHLLDELAGRLFQAVVGASRLPLTSVEAPLPSFSLGQLFYCHSPPADVEEPARAWPELLARLDEEGTTASERAKLLETLLHAVPAPEVPDMAVRLRDRPAGEPAGLLRTIFNEASLTPWTDLVDKAVALADALEGQGTWTAAEGVDFLAARLCQLGRHLTAYDLVTFHHRGANYPDALQLDAFLKAYLRRLERRPDLFAGEEGRLRRRALRQAWLLRRSYEGHPVPDAPTSPGENQRVLPGHTRVPEEQILHVHKRRRRLYEGDPLPSEPGGAAGAALRASIDDLAHVAEWMELGTALFLDRPLGAGKAPGEPDQTVLLSHLALSRAIIRRRLAVLAAHAELAPSPQTRARMEELCNREFVFDGVPVAEVAARTRPGAVSVADARQVADDFVVLRTTSSTLGALFRQYDFGPLAAVGPAVALPADDPPGLVLYDRQDRPLARLDLNLAEGYASWGGNEYLLGGLRGEGVEVRPRDVR